MKRKRTQCHFIQGVFKVLPNVLTVYFLLLDCCALALTPLHSMNPHTDNLLQKEVPVHKHYSSCTVYPQVQFYCRQALYFCVTVK